MQVSLIPSVGNIPKRLHIVGGRTGLRHANATRGGASTISLCLIACKPKCKTPKFTPTYWAATTALWNYSWSNYIRLIHLIATVNLPLSGKWGGFFVSIPKGETTWSRTDVHLPRLELAQQGHRKTLERLNNRTKRFYLSPKIIRCNVQDIGLVQQH